MHVNPAYQKQGLGKMLLDWGLQKAREKGKRVFLLASPTGKRLYEKNGFTVFEEGKLDLAIFGGEGEYTQSVIVWEGDGGEGREQ
jgi:predicted N-acetyltransferase YhbS